MGIDLPFTNENVKKILEGRKDHTTRTQHYHVGDIFTVFDDRDPYHTHIRKYVIIQAFRTRIGYIRDRYWKGEGYSSSKEFEVSWCRLHPRENKNGFDPDKLKWHYVFAPSDNPGGKFF